MLLLGPRCWHRGVHDIEDIFLMERRRCGISSGSVCKFFCFASSWHYTNKDLLGWMPRGNGWVGIFTVFGTGETLLHNFENCAAVNRRGCIYFCLTPSWDRMLFLAPCWFGLIPNWGHEGKLTKSGLLEGMMFFSLKSKATGTSLDDGVFVYNYHGISNLDPCGHIWCCIII